MGNINLLKTQPEKLSADIILNPVLLRLSQGDIRKLA